MNKFLKTALILASLLAASSLWALSLAEASAKIDQVIANPDMMTATMKELSPTNQVAFLSRVNAAIASLPGSAEEKAANYLAVNAAALRGAASGNLSTLLAEVYATVPPEALTLINERFAAELFNRSANPSRPISDEQVASIALSMMEKIHARNVGSENSAVRDTFALLMFLRVADGSPADLQDRMLNFIDSSSRELAESEWIPAAMGENQPKTYEPMLGASDAGEQPDVDIVLQMRGPQTSLALLADLNAPAGETPSTSMAFASSLNTIPDAMGAASGLDRIPRTDDPSKKWWGGYTREPDGYAYQTTGGTTP